MKRLSTYKSKLWRYLGIALWLCCAATSWGQTVLERGDVAGSMKTLKKKVLYIFSLLFISTFLYAQIPNPIVLEWAFPEQPGVENPTLPAKDAIWFAPSTNNYPTLFGAKPASYGPGVERDGIISCVNYNGIVGGLNGCGQNDYAIIAKGWTTASSRSNDDYIQFEFDISNMACHDFSNSTGVISFDAMRSSQGPTKIDLYAVADVPGFGVQELYFPNSRDLSVNQGWRFYSINSFDIGAFGSLFTLVQTFGVDNIKIRIYGYNANSGAGTLRIDNFRLQLNDALDQTPTTFTDLNVPTEACSESDLPVLNNLPTQSNQSEGVWSLENVGNVYTYTFTPSVMCFATYQFEVILLESPDVGVISGDSEVCVGQSIHLSSTVSGGTWSSEDDAIATVDANTGEVTGVSAGEVEISYTVGSDNLCPDSSESITITVNPVPITSPITH